MKNGFTLIEVLIVIVLIGILSALAYSSLNELIQTNKAKEAARLMTTFVERSLTESKMRQAPVAITINGSTINAKIGEQSSSSMAQISETIPNGFSASNASGINTTGLRCNSVTPNEEITSQPKIGVSGIDGIKCFVACTSGGVYCGAAIKEDTRNNFIAQIKRKNSGWEDL
jgi:prepilin-type N-terminal cleavage/methylation domain-containing protein